jgi:hypothetical protein
MEQARVWDVVVGGANTDYAEALTDVRVKDRRGARLAAERLLAHGAMPWGSCSLGSRLNPDDTNT